MVRSTCAQLDLEGRGCVGDGRAALRVDRFSSRYQCGLVYAQAMHTILRSAIQLSRMAVCNCLANAQGAPVSQMDMYR